MKCLIKTIMAAKSLRQKKKFRNYICAFVATYKTGVALEQFTEHGLQLVHNHILQTLGNLPACQKQCSQTERNINRWCVSCASWRKELEKFIPFGTRINWHDKKSWCWPNGVRKIAEVFILPGWPNSDINLQDISTIFNVWNRCLQFPRNVVQVLAPLKDCRNELVHNRANMRLTNARKKTVFQNIMNVINHPDIIPLIHNHADVIRMVLDLKRDRLFRDDIEFALRHINLQNEKIRDALDRLTFENRETNRTVKRLSLLLIALIVLFGIMFWSLMILMYMLLPSCTQTQLNNLSQTESWSGTLADLHKLRSTEGCLPEASSYKDVGRISLFEYISHHQLFIGREWLIKNIEMGLQATGTNNHGILVEAGMGYGKSALIKNIICANKTSPAFKLRRRLVAYHVCRFDVLVSKKAHIFVLRLISMISAQIPVLADQINSCKEVFDRKMCENDPHGCLDQCVIIPLKTLSHLNREPVVIVLDGLDECYDKLRDVNEILDLLKQRLYQFPAWVKCLITSRTNLARLGRLTQDLQSMDLLDDSAENKNDITAFILQSALNKSALIHSKLENFQLVTLLLKNNTNLDENATPKSLSSYYYEQFNRLYGSDGRQFIVTRTILEILITTFQSPIKSNIWNVLSKTTNVTLQQFEKSFNLLNNVIRKIGEEYRLIHESLHQWLVSSENEDFFVSTDDGHKLNALYLFSLIENGHYNTNVVDLAIHTGLSSDPFLHEKFLDLHEIQVEKIGRHRDEYPLVELAKRVDHFIATNLLASHFSNVDKKSKDNHTALFIAASLGHAKTFEALIKWKADITFRTRSYENIINFENALKVSVEHMFWDYGILDIAAQNGHDNIVEYILQNNKILFHYPISTLNLMMLLPIHLACKKGHLSIVKRLYYRYNWMLDWQCLYYASEIGQTDLVAFILQNKVDDRCSVCKTYIHWVPEKHLRVQGQMLYSEENKLVLFDDWNNISCESALHVAVRENKLNVVKILVNQRKNAAKCFDRGGRTPGLAAVQYGHKDIVEYFISSGLLKGKEKCSAARRLKDAFKLHNNEITKLQQYFCEDNMSLPHIIAKYDQTWIVDMLHRYDVRLDWNITDSLSCYPIHKAACHGSIGVLKSILDTLHKDFRYFKCLDGSNPLHSAIACGSVSATEFLLLRYNKYNSESSVEKMSYINHAILRDNDVSLAKDVDELEQNTSKIMSMLVTRKSDLEVRDKMERNVLHHVIQKGHYRVLSNLFSYFPNTVIYLIKTTDYNKTNPLIYALRSLKPYSQFYLPWDIFSNDKVEATPLDRMSPKEYSILLTLKFMMQSGKLKMEKHLLTHISSKQCLNIITFLLDQSNKTLTEGSSFLSVVLENDRYGLQVFAYLTAVIKRLGQFKPETRRKAVFEYLFCGDCHEIINKCNLHLLALNYLKVSKIFSYLHADILDRRLLELFFLKSKAATMSDCYDSDGYNILERAIQGGSHLLVRHLIEFGVKSERSKISLLRMALNGFKYRSEEEYFILTHIPNARNLQVSFLSQERILQEFGADIGLTTKASLLTNISAGKIETYSYYHYPFRNNSDLLTSELLTAYHYAVRKEEVCAPATVRFSLIHRLAFEGLLSSLKLAVKYWGKIYFSVEH